MSEDIKSNALQLHLMTEENAQKYVDNLWVKNKKLDSLINTPQTEDFF